MVKISVFFPLALYESAGALETLVLVMIFLQALKNHVASRVLDIWEGRTGGGERGRVILVPKIM